MLVGEGEAVWEGTAVRVEVGAVVKVRVAPGVDVAVRDGIAVEVKARLTGGGEFAADGPHPESRQEQIKTVMTRSWEVRLCMGCLSLEEK